MKLKWNRNVLVKLGLKLASVVYASAIFTKVVEVVFLLEIIQCIQQGTSNRYFRISSH